MIDTQSTSAGICCTWKALIELLFRIRNNNIINDLMILEQIKKKSLRLSDGRVYPTVTGSLVTVNPGFTLSKLPGYLHKEVLCEIYLITSCNPWKRLCRLGVRSMRCL